MYKLCNEQMKWLLFKLEVTWKKVKDLEGKLYKIFYVYEVFHF